MNSTRKAEFLNVPNYISLGRILSVPLLVVFMMLINDFSPERYAWNLLWSGVAGIVFIVASVSDMIDGFIARKYRIGSTFGKFFDPLADKLLNLTAMIMLIPLGRIPAWFVVLILVREIGITMLRGVAANERIMIPASKWGKYKTAFGSFGIGGLIVHYPFFGVEWMLIGWLFLIISAVFSIGSGIHYVYKFVKEISKQA